VSNIAGTLIGEDFVFVGATAYRPRLLLLDVELRELLELILLVIFYLHNLAALSGG